MLVVWEQSWLEAMQIRKIPEQFVSYCGWPVVTRQIALDVHRAASDSSGAVVSGKFELRSRCLA